MVLSRRGMSQPPALFAAATCNARGVSPGGCPCCVEIASGGVQLQHARTSTCAWPSRCLRPLDRASCGTQGCAAIATIRAAPAPDERATPAMITLRKQQVPWQHWPEARRMSSPRHWGLGSAQSRGSSARLAARLASPGRTARIAWPHCLSGQCAP